MEPKIVFLDVATLSIGDIDFKALEWLGKVTMYPRTLPSEVVARCVDADIVITNKVVLDSQIIPQLTSVNYICVAATGYNNIDLAAAKKASIPVSNVSGYSTQGVVQHVFAMLLDVLHRVGRYNQEVSKGKWQECVDFSYYSHSINELAGKTMGIYGYGNIGRQVGAIAKAFGMEVIATRRQPQRDLNDDVVFVDIEELFSSADVISLHAPLSDSNREVVNYNLLSKMKSSGILINTARGGLIAESDLAKALEEKLLSFACLDVLSQEPPPKDHPLIGIDRCIITPHQAWASLESRQRLLAGIVENITAFIYGTQLTNRVG